MSSFSLPVSISIINFCPISPSDNETDIARNPSVTVTFSQEMDSLTIDETSFLLEQGNTNIAGEVEYSGQIATFTPLGTLSATTEYTATITTSAKSTSGETLENDYVWRFTTGGSAESIEEVDLGSAGDYVILAQTAVVLDGNTITQ